MSERTISLKDRYIYLGKVVSVVITVWAIIQIFFLDTLYWGIPTGALIGWAFWPLFYHWIGLGEPE